jgi:hypothetical protein
MWLTGESKGAPVGISTDRQLPKRFGVYLNALLATRLVARCVDLCWVETVERLVSLLTGTKLPPPFPIHRQASQNIRCLAQVQVFADCAQQRQPPPFASEYAGVPMKT